MLRGFLGGQAEGAVEFDAAEEDEEGAEVEGEEGDQGAELDADGLPIDEELERGHDVAAVGGEGEEVEQDVAGLGADEHAGAEADDDHGDLLDRDQAEDLADAHADALTDGELDAAGLGGDGHQHDQAE